jgi:hypothetical protein
MITSSAITWGNDLEGTLVILSLEGKEISRNDLSSAGEYAFDQLIPGMYVAAVEREDYMMWARVFFVR